MNNIQIIHITCPVMTRYRLQDTFIAYSLSGLDKVLRLILQLTFIIQYNKQHVRQLMYS